METSAPRASRSMRAPAPPFQLMVATSPPGGRARSVRRAAWSPATTPHAARVPTSPSPSATASATPSQRPGASPARCPPSHAATASRRISPGRAPALCPKRRGSPEQRSHAHMIEHPADAEHPPSGGSRGRPAALHARPSPPCRSQHQAVHFRHAPERRLDRWEA